MTMYVQTPAGAAMPCLVREQAEFLAEVERKICGHLVCTDPDLEEDDGDDYLTHMRFECRQDRFV